MKNNVQMGIMLSLLLVSIASFGQTKITDLQATTQVKKTAKTYLDLMVNVVSTNLNYGAGNSSLADYKQSLNGIQAGASFQAGITPGFSLVSEIYYLRKGGKLKAGNPLSLYESTLRINTLELPVLARFHFGKLYVNAGPSLAYNISGKQKFNDVSTKIAFDNSSKSFQRFDAGIQMGGGIELPFKQRRIALDLRYSYGLTNISKFDEIYNRALMVSVHFSKAWKTNPLAKR